MCSGSFAFFAGIRFGFFKDYLRLCRGVAWEKYNPKSLYLGHEGEHEFAVAGVEI
jgi:hypothetical protein